MRKRFTALEAGLLVSTNFGGRTVAGRDSLAAPHRYQCRVAVCVHVKAVAPRLRDGERNIWRVNFIDFAAEQVGNVQIQRALVQLNLYSAVSEVGQRNAGLTVHAQRRGPKMQFGTRIAIRPHIVSGS